MNRAFHLSLLASAFVLASAQPARAGEVYQWKDASGVTHYSQTPPPQGKYQSRNIYHRTPAGDGTAAADAPRESSQCTTARKNMELLNSGVALQIDSNADGKPDRELSSAEREKQMLMNQTVIRVQCNTAEPNVPQTPKSNSTF